MVVSGHLLSRGVAAYLNQPRDGGNGGDGSKPEPVVIDLPTWVIVMLGVTVVGFVFVMTMVRGMLCSVQLCAVQIC